MVEGFQVEGGQERGGMAEGCHGGGAPWRRHHGTSVDCRGRPHGHEALSPLRGSSRQTTDWL